jgi:adenylate cyclase
MHFCPICGTSDPQPDGLCQKCAIASELRCPTCGQSALAGSRFCSRCGTRLADRVQPAPTPALEAQVPPGFRALMPAPLAGKTDATVPALLGEQREVTVLFLDMIEFGTTEHALDSEDSYLLTDEAMRHLVEVVYKYEGTIDRYTDNGFMALMGLPVAHENDPERAVRAALEMQTTLLPLRDRVKQKYGVEVQTRVGVHTGRVIVGRMASDLRTEYTVIGDTVTVADQLQRSVQPNTIAVSFATYQRTRPLFRYRSLPPQQAKADLPPIRAFRPLGLRARPGQTRGLSGLQVPMVGRQDGLDHLEQALNQVSQRRQSQIVWISGEAGVGKSRLVTEFCRSIDQHDVSIYQGSCLSYARSTPFWLLAGLLRDIMHLSDTDPAEVQREALQSFLGQLDLANGETLPYLANVLGLEQTGSSLPVHLHLLDNEALQKLTHTALRQVLLAEARLAPVMLILEDLHWIDPASKAFLEHLIPTLDGVPLLLILISRQIERDTAMLPLLAAARRHPNPLVDIQLRPLSKAEGQKLVDHLLVQTTEEAQPIKHRIAMRAEGNPFYAEEIVRMLIEQGGLVQNEDRWEATHLAHDLLQEVPGTLKGLLQARLDHLPEPLRRTLQKAATLGTSFPLGLLQGLDGATADTVADHVLELESRQLIIPTSSDSTPIYAFRHTLIQEVVYGTLLKRDRQSLHQEVAEAIERDCFWLPDEQTETLAYHYAESANPSRAVPHLIAAAENAARRCANETAIQHYRRALALMDRESASSDQLLTVQMGLGRALKFVGEYSEANHTLKEALKYLLRPDVMKESSDLIPRWVHGLKELADIQVREGSPGEAIAYLKAGLDVLGDEGAEAYPGVWRLLVDRLAWVRFRQGKLEDALSLASSATLDLDLGSADDPLTHASLYNTLGGIFWQQGNLPEATTYVERSLDLYRRLGYLWGMANAYSNLGVLYYRRGDWPRALENWERSLDLRRTIGDLQHQATTLNNLGFLRTSMGEHKLAQRNLQDGLAIGRKLGDDWIIAQSLISLAYLSVVESHFGEAAAHAKAALTLAETISSKEIEVQARWILALAQAERDDFEAGLRSARQALHLAHDGGFLDLQADCLRVLGVLLARTGNWLEAETHFRESIERCLQQNDPYRRGLALYELGRMYQRLAHAGDLSGSEWQAKGLQAVEEAAEQFERLGATSDLQAARATLSQVRAEMTAKVPVRLPEGEWRAATILWLELTIAPEEDEEVVFEAMATAMSSLTAIVQQYQGQAIRHRTGLSAVFGAPVAYEDDAERAVQAAMRMVQYLGEQAALQVPLTFKVGISQGDVVAGRMGPSFRVEFVARGEPVDVAKSVAELAPHGQVWVTDAVRDATERLFTYQVVPQAITDPRAHAPLWFPTGLREQPGAPRGLPGIRARFIGRETPLQAMIALSKHLDEGVGGLIWIEGEPGIGKSRLISEFTAALAADGILHWSGRCSPQRTNYAFSLFADLLGQALRLQSSATPEQIRARLDHCVQTWPVDAQAMRPYLEILLGLPPEGLHSTRLASLQPEQLRQQVFVALRRLFRSLAIRQPLVLSLDDLHWIDPVSAELLLFLLTMVTSVPILFVCAQRRQGADLPNDRLIRVHSLIPSQTIRLQLERLSLVESEMLLAELLSGTDLSATLKTIILERSEGNPYFIEEYVRMLIEKDYIRQGQGHWEIEPNRQIAEIPLPSSLETLVRSRLDALPGELKQLVQYAAVIGAPFEATLLESISELSNVRSLLNRLESRLIVHRGSEANQWFFTHSVIETVAYESMLRARRKALHRQVAVALEARWLGIEADHAETLAYHFTQGDEGAKALCYLVLAGERAIARYANEEALSFLEQAARRLDTETEVADDLRWRVSAGLGDAHRAMGQYAESRIALERELALQEAGGLSATIRAGFYRRLGETCQKQGELDSAHEHFSKALTILGTPTDRQAQQEGACILAGMAWAYFRQGHFEYARQACEASLEYAGQAGALSELASAENLLGGVYYQQSEWESALHHTTRAMVLREQMGYTWGVASTLNNLGILAHSTGQWSKARSFLERSLTLREEMGDVEGVVIAHNNLGTLIRDQGDLDLAEFHFKKSLAVGTPFKMSFHIITSNMGLAQIQLLKGQIEAADEFTAASLAQAEAIGAKDLLAETYLTRAQTLLARSAQEEARMAVGQSIALAAATGNRSLEAVGWRLASKIELHAGQSRVARETLDMARQALTDVTNELEFGRVAVQAAHIDLFEARGTQAEKELRVAQEIFVRLGANLDLEHVEETFRRLSSAEVDGLAGLRRVQPTLQYL